MSLLISSDFWFLILAFAGVFAVFTLGLQIQVGTGGLTNLGHVAFLAIGAYAMAISVREGVPAIIAAAIGVLLSGLVAVLLAWPTMRLRGGYFAIATLAFGEIVRIVLLNEDQVTNGTRGLVGYDSAWKSIAKTITGILQRLGWTNPDPKAAIAIATWALALIVALVLRKLQRTQWGRVMRAIREDEDLVRSVGKSATTHRLQAIGIGGAIAGLAGVFYALNLGVIAPNFFVPPMTFMAFAMLLVGGPSSPFGALLGAFLVSTIVAGSQVISIPLSAVQVSALRSIFVGMLLIVFVAFRPQGIIGSRAEILFQEQE